jgi:DNA-binding transcriptional MocR family regulator
MAVPAMAETVSRLIQNGGLAGQVHKKREKAALRDAIVRRILKSWLPQSFTPPAFHIWLPLPAGRTITALVAQAAQAGITLAPPGAPRSLDDASPGIRLCLGAPPSESVLESAMTAMRRILEQPEAISFI